MAKIIISLPDKLLQKVDAYSREHKYNRSEFIRFALRKIVDKEDVQKSIQN